jgi:hypothetical protein
MIMMMMTIMMCAANVDKFTKSLFTILECWVGLKTSVETKIKKVELKLIKKNESKFNIV